MSEPTPTMPFGKFKGTPMSEVPKWYARWCLTNMDRLSPLLRSQLDAVAGGKPIPATPPKWTPGGDDWYLSDGVLKQIEGYFGGDGKGAGD